MNFTDEHDKKIMEACQQHCDKCREKEVEAEVKKTLDNGKHLGLGSATLDIDSIMVTVEADYRAGMGLDPLGEE